MNIAAGIILIILGVFQIMSAKKDTTYLKFMFTDYHTGGLKHRAGVYVREGDSGNIDVTLDGKKYVLSLEWAKSREE